MTLAREVLKVVRQATGLALEGMATTTGAVLFAPLVIASLVWSHAKGELR